jgi:multicomponent Na+:H+ antiporter subunit F
MSVVYIASALVLLLTLVLGLFRIVVGPTEVDRMLSAQLFGTTGVAVLLLLAHGLDTPSLVDAALVVALLAVIAAVAFVRRIRQPAQAREDR